MVSFSLSLILFFFLVSQMVIEEVSAIQENLEIERTCRESAEALASKVHVYTVNHLHYFYVTDIAKVL